MISYLVVLQQPRTQILIHALLESQTAKLYTLSLHDALPISAAAHRGEGRPHRGELLAYAHRAAHLRSPDRLHRRGERRAEARAARQRHRAPFPDRLARALRPRHDRGDVVRHAGDRLAARLGAGDRRAWRHRVHRGLGRGGGRRAAPGGQARPRAGAPALRGALQRGANGAGVSPGLPRPRPARGPAPPHRENRMNRDGTVAAPTVFVPGVVSLAASSRRTLKHGDSFAMFDEFGDIVEVEHSPAGLFHHDTRFLSRLHFTLEGHRPLMLSSTVQPDNLVLDVDLTNPDMFQGDRLV